MWLANNFCAEKAVIITQQLLLTSLAPMTARWRFLLERCKAIRLSLGWRAEVHRKHTEQPLVFPCWIDVHHVDARVAFGYRLAN